MHLNILMYWTLFAKDVKYVYAPPVFRMYADTMGLYTVGFVVVLFVFISKGNTPTETWSLYNPWYMQWAH